MIGDPKTMQDLGYVYCPICGTRLPQQSAPYAEIGGIVVDHMAHLYGQPDRYDPQTGRRSDHG